MKRMNKTDEARMANTLMDAVGRINAGENPNDVITDIADTHGFSSERAARLCEASNKLASIERLSSKDKDTRTAVFPLADVTEVMQRLERPRKVTKVAATAIRKTASDGVAKYMSAPSPTMVEEDRLYVTRCERAQKIASDLSDFRTTVDEHEQASRDANVEFIGAEESLKELVSEARSMGNDDAAELARYIGSTYGDQGKELIRLLNGLLDDQMPEPSVKEAAAYIPVNRTSGMRLADRFMEHSYNHLIAKANTELAVKKALDPVDAASDLWSYVSGTTEDIKKEKPTQNTTKNPFTREVYNKLKELELKDSFANMYLDDKFLLSYPPETVIDAYNKVIQLYPGLVRRQNSDALVTSMVKKILTSNNEIDPLEIAGAARADKEFAQAQKEIDQSWWD